MLTLEQIGGIVVKYALECGALNNNKYYASYKRYPVFVADTLEDSVEQCVKFWITKGVFK